MDRRREVHINVSHVGNARRIATLVKTVLVEAIPTADDGEIQFRIEVFSWADQEYSCQIWRYDAYRIQPTFQETFPVADEEWIVLDLGLAWRDLRAPSADQLLELVFEEIERKLGVKVSR